MPSSSRFSRRKAKLSLRSSDTSFLNVPRRQTDCKVFVQFSIRYNLEQFSCTFLPTRPLTTSKSSFMKQLKSHFYNIANPWQAGTLSTQTNRIKQHMACSKFYIHTYIHIVTKKPGRGLTAGESSSSAAPPETGATLDISDDVFGGPAVKVRGAAAACWSATAGNSVASRGNSEETELPDRGFSSSTSKPDLPWSFMPMVVSDWQS